MTHHGSDDNHLMELRICPICHAVQAKGSSCNTCGKPLTLVNADYLSGWQLGKYRLIRALGAGGMGMVYQASHSTLKKTVALKILLPRINSDTGEFARRFLREARVLAELHHPNIVEIFDMDLTQWGAPYFVMEHLTGLPLDNFIYRHNGPLPEPWVAEITKGLASGLAFAHGRGIIHRDLKPENIFLSLYGKAMVPKILDFGIAKLVSEHGDSTRLTSTGAVVGTPEYLTPEQVLNKELGGWTDQYTLALLVAEMLTGKCPRAGKSLLEIVSTEIHHPLDLISLGIPVEKPFANALFRATQPDPDNRFETMEAFLKALQLKQDENGVKNMTEWLMTAVSESENEAAETASVSTEPGEELYSGSHPFRAADTPTRRLSPSNRQKPPLKNRSNRYHPGWKLWTAFALFTLVAMITGWKLMKAKGALTGKTTIKAKLMGKTYPVIKRVAEWNLPPDSKRILGQNEKEILIRGIGGVYLLNNKTGKTAKILFPQKSFFLSGDNSIGVFLFKNGSILHWNPKRNQMETITNGLPSLATNEKIISGKLNPGQTRMLYVTNRMIRLVAFDKNKSRVLYTRKTEGSKIFIAMGQQMVAITLPNGEICVIRMEDGHIAATFHVKELRLYSLAISEPLHLVAIGGWFDKVYLFDYLNPDNRITIPQKGETHSVTWLGNGTTLTAGGVYGAFLWNRRDGLIGRIPVKQSGQLTQIFRGEGAILTLDENLKLSTFYFNRIRGGTNYKLGNNSLWAMGTGPSNHIFSGDSRGELYEFNKSGRLKTYSLHTLGIGALISDGKFLATASDDKTIAVWQLPQMQVEWRSRVHKFLVTGICLTKKTLWSVSSDGDIKEWSWPDLEPIHVFQISEMLNNRKTSCQSIWSNSTGQRILVGSWDMGIISLEKKGKREYHWAHYQTTAKVIYQVAQVPGMDLVAFSAFNPYAAYLYDLQKNKLYKLPIYQAALTALCSGRSHEVWYYGPGSIMQYRFTRDQAGDVHVKVSGGMESSLGIGISGCLSTDSQYLVIGNETGKVFWWDIGQLEQHFGPPVSEILDQMVPVTDSGTIGLQPNVE